MTAAAVDVFIPEGEDYEFDRRARATVDGQQVVRGAENHDIVRDVARRPWDYLADVDAFRVELWVDPFGWNEGHEYTRTPVLTYYVASGSDAAHIIQGVETDGGRWVAATGETWTGIEVRTTPASSKARMTDADDVVAAMRKWTLEGGLQRHIP